MNNEFITLYPGIELCYLTFSSDSFSVQHKAMAHMIQINYCKAGQLIWEMENGNRIYLNPGDFSLHTIKVCADSVLTFPGNMYQGLTICIDLQEASGNPPELLKSGEVKRQRRGAEGKPSLNRAKESVNVDPKPGDLPMSRLKLP